MNPKLRELDTTPPRPLRVGELRARMASTLGISSGAINIVGQQMRGRKVVQQCWGTAGKRRFFGKVYLGEVYPVEAHFATPWEDLECPEPPLLSAEEQVTVEMTAFQRVLGLMGTRNIPVLLACSLSQRTLVCERVEGVSLESLFRHPLLHFFRARGSNMRSLECAMSQAGAWLRALHNASSQGYEMMEPEEIADGLRALLQKRQMEDSTYAQLARRMFAPLTSGLRSAIRVPIALNHGDFTFANLLWNRDRQNFWVIDFALSRTRPITHDLCTFVAALRRELLLPLTSPRMVRNLEDAFWKGYGRIAESIRTIVDCLSCASPFYRDLPRLSLSDRAAGWRGRVSGLLYRQLLQDLMFKRMVRAEQSAGTGLGIGANTVPHHATNVASRP